MISQFFRRTLFSAGLRALKTPHPLADKCVWFFPFAILVTVLAAGCGESRVPVYPVSGKISFQGRPPVGAQVVLHPVDHTEPSDIAPIGIVQGDGSFHITAYEPDDGAPIGHYVATVQWFKIVSDANGGGGGRGPNVLPKEYASARTSPIKVQVTENGAEIPAIEIARR